jgi:cytoskeletal protein CcmA (bactofilin family)
MKKQSNPNNTSFIAEGTTITADINSDGNIHISGSVLGEIKTKLHVILNNKGKITGNTIAQTAMISGIIEGDIRVLQTLTLHASAKVNGNIYAKHLITEHGAEINGTIKTGSGINVLEEQPVKEVSLQKKAG